MHTPLEAGQSLKWGIRSVLVRAGGVGRKIQKQSQGHGSHLSWELEARAFLQLISLETSRSEVNVHIRKTMPGEKGLFSITSFLYLFYLILCL